MNYAAPEYLIRATNEDIATALAETRQLTKPQWVFIPHTLDDYEDGVFQQVTDTSSVADDDDTWYTVILLSANFWEAAKHATTRKLNAKSWSWVEVPPLNTVVEYQLVD